VLYILGYETEAYRVLEQFKWGETFFSLNADLLRAYRRCQNRAEILEVQGQILQNLIKS